ncbi:hypothetical protein WJX75_000105 [Coccomyxa subellipsoidea]|uniref:Nop52-domain-containing protein n=1 Tax=Coccomyxa subellipsoidea TaxID=248742 RepID=A0ABR2YX15_9CHLO
MCEARIQGEAVEGQDRPAKARKMRKGLEPIWKALFFCFWHSDKAHVQAELAERLAALLPLMSAEGALLYFKVFAKTMQREWFGIDKLRLDKFMMLVRKFMHQLFVHLQEGGWDSETTASYCAFLSEEVFLMSDREPSAGFSLHLADIAITELCAACNDAGPVPRDALEALLEPFCIAAARTKRPALLARLQDGVFGELLQIGSTGALANLDMRTVAARLFDLGAEPEVKARNREVLYALSKLFQRAETKRQKKLAGLPTPVAAGPAGQGVSTPVSAPGAAARLTESQRKKQVKFQMKNNLYFEKGGPVPPAEVRTPPTAKPKGSALKKTSSVASRPKSPRMASVELPKRKAKAALFF